MIVIVIPAYNEGERINEVISKISLYYPDYKILVVNDGSTDDTYLKSWEADWIVNHPFNMGLGAATRTGLQRAYEFGADIAVKIDADFQHDPEDIRKVINPILKDEADCVFGTRFKGGLKYKMPLYRAMGNKFFSFIVTLLTGINISDGQTGLMAFHRRYLKNFKIISNYNETQQLIMDAYGKNMRIIEVPVLFHKRITGKSFISWKYPLKVIPTILRMFMSYGSVKVFTIFAMLFLIFGHIQASMICFMLGLFADLVTTK